MEQTRCLFGCRRGQRGGPYNHSGVLFRRQLVLHKHQVFVNYVFCGICGGYVDVGIKSGVAFASSAVTLASFMALEQPIRMCFGLLWEGGSLPIREESR